MSGLSFFLIFAGLFGLLFWLRIPGNGGALGRAVRESDHAAWVDAVEDTQRLISDLRERRMTGTIQYEDLLDYLDELVRAEPRL